MMKMCACRASIVLAILSGTPQSVAAHCLECLGETIACGASVIPCGAGERTRVAWLASTAAGRGQRNR